MAPTRGSNGRKLTTSAPGGFADSGRAIGRRAHPAHHSRLPCQSGECRKLSLEPSRTLFHRRKRGSPRISPRRQMESCARKPPQRHELFGVGT